MRARWSACGRLARRCQCTASAYGAMPSGKANGWRSLRRIGGDDRLPDGVRCRRCRGVRRGASAGLRQAQRAGARSDGDGGAAGGDAPRPGVQRQGDGGPHRPCAFRTYCRRKSSALHPYRRSAGNLRVCGEPRAVACAPGWDAGGLRARRRREGRDPRGNGCPRSLRCRMAFAHRSATGAPSVRMHREQSPSKLLFTSTPTASKLGTKGMSRNGRTGVDK